MFRLSHGRGIRPFKTEKRFGSILKKFWKILRVFCVTSPINMSDSKMHLLTTFLTPFLCQERDQKNGILYSPIRLRVPSGSILKVFVTFSKIYFCCSFSRSLFFYLNVAKIVTGGQLSKTCNKI